MLLGELLGELGDEVDCLLLWHCSGKQIRHDFFGCRQFSIYEAVALDVWVYQLKVASLDAP